MFIESKLANLNIDLEIDATGLNCPLPILKARKGLMQLSSGQLLKITATDPASQADFPSFCELTGNQLVSQQTVDDIYIFIVKSK